MWHEDFGPTSMSILAPFPCLAPCLILGYIENEVNACRLVIWVTPHSSVRDTRY